MSVVDVPSSKAMSVPRRQSESAGEDRVVDRSGDLDQRPEDERAALPNIILPLQPPSPMSRERPALPDRPQFVPLRLPPAHDLPEIAARLQGELDAEYAKARGRLDSLRQRIEGGEKRCAPPKIDAELQRTRFERQKVLIANGPALADRLRDERNALADLDRFKAENRITREAHYPSSQLLAIGILAMLIVIESGINGVLFADSSDQGLLGGWLEALVLSLTNVGAAFLLGRFIFPQLHRRRFVLRSCAVLASALGIAALLAINLFGAHYRDSKIELARTVSAAPGEPPLPARRAEITSPAGKRGVRTSSGHANPSQNGNSANEAKPEARQDAAGLAPGEGAIAKVLVAPFDVQSFSSFFLLVLGLCAATLAAVDGYKLDDPLPGYGRRHRGWVKARARSGDALRRVLDQANAIVSGSFQALDRKIDAYGSEVAALQALHYAYAGEYRASQARLDEALWQGEDDIRHVERLTCKSASRGSPEVHGLSVGRLSELSEKHVKFLELHEKKLAAVKKNLLKEQGSVLDMFEGASADFQTLLVEASRARLKSALPDHLSTCPPA